MRSIAEGSTGRIISLAFQNLDIQNDNLLFLEIQSPKKLARNPKTQGNHGGPSLAGELLFYHRRQGKYLPALRFAPAQVVPATHRWCGSPAGEKAPEHTVATFWRP
jgi:hypothetical protein